MSRSVFGLFAFLMSFPRVSGDEPPALATV